jgi:VTC domain
MSPEIEQGLSHYKPISLKQLNENAEMMARIDNKYIVKGKALLPAIAALADYFDVLEIDGKRAFEYSSCYFDDTDRRGYYDHHQRRRKRCKVRVREYVDAGIYFLEVKLNEQRAMTTKRRLQIDEAITSLDEGIMSFVDGCYNDCYHEHYEKQLVPVINISYQRITLVAKQGGERLTLDTGICFCAEDTQCETPEDTYIIETKSARGNGIADKILRAIHVKPTKRVSKFCLGMVATGQVGNHNGFLPALRQLELAEFARF